MGPAQRMTLMTIEAAIRATDPMRTISGLIFTPWVASLKKVRRPALDAGIGALSFLLLILRQKDPALFLRITLDGHFASKFFGSPPRTFRNTLYPQFAQVGEGSFASSFAVTRVPQRTHS